MLAAAAAEEYPDLEFVHLEYFKAHSAQSSALSHNNEAQVGPQKLGKPGECFLNFASVASFAVILLAEC